MMISWCNKSVLVWFSACVLANRPPTRWEPLPPCSDCVSPKDIIAPGLGIDLTFSYATAAIRYHNGSLEDLIKVDAGDDFRQLAIRMRASPPIPHCWNGGRYELRCRLQYAKRSLNKLLGRPSTPDVGTIAKLLKVVRDAADAKLGSDISDEVYLAFPVLPGLSHDDWQDALEHVGLDRLPMGLIQEKCSEVEVTFAGSGYGLCEHYVDLDDCEVEEANLPLSHVLAVTLTQDSFTAISVQMRGVSSTLGYFNKEITCFDLGLNVVDSNSTLEDPSRYWARIREVIIEVGRTSRGRLNTLLLSGEEGHNPSFTLVVQDALRELLPNASPHEISTLVLPERVKNDSLDPLWLASRGAAELAKRRLEAPRGCKEPAHCTDNRHREAPSYNSHLLAEQRQAVLLEL